MSFTPGSLVFILGAMQAIILLIGININKPFQSDLKKITSFLLGCMAIVMLYYVVILNRLSSFYTIADTLGMAAWMSITPFFYLLCKSLLLPGWTWKKRSILYFTIPIYFLLAGLLVPIGLDMRLWALFGSMQNVLDIWMLLFFGSGLFFIGKSYLLIRQQDDEDQNKELKIFINIFLSMLIVFGIIYAVIRSAYAVWFELVLICLFLVFILILIYRIFKAAPFHTFFDFNKYGNNSLDKDQQANLALKLERLMKEEKPYLDKKLSLNDLSKLSKINTNELSQLFNAHYKSNFYEFVNRYRISYLEKLMLNPDFAQFKITALAEKSGFNSKATFYKAFKNKHQLTPSQFIKAHKRKD